MRGKSTFAPGLTAMLAPKPFDSAGQPIAQRDFWGAAKERPHPGVVRYAARNILVAVTINLFLPDELDFGSVGPKEFKHQFGELEHRSLNVGADNDRLAVGLGPQPGLH